MIQIRNHNLLEAILHIHGEPYYTVRPTAVIRIEQWDNMLEWAKQEFGTASEFRKGCVGQRVSVNKPGERYYIDNTRFWFRHKKECEKFLQYWS